MTNRALSLSLLFAITLASCEGEPPIVAPRPPPPPPPPPVVAPPPGPPTITKTLEDVGLDSTALDRSADPCGDFFQFACGGWLKKTEIPADRSRWNRSFSEIAKRTETDLKAILEKARGASDPVSKKLGAYYGACMDEEAIEKAKLKPLQPLLKKAQGVRNPRELARVLGELHAQRIWAMFDINDDQDYKDATKVIATMDQNGLGLPDRDNYLEEDEKSKELRKKYVEHVERMMKLIGFDKRAAKTAAEDVMHIETELAKISKTRVERRDPKGLYNRVDRDGLKKLAPDFPWDEYFKSLGAEGLAAINVTSPRFFEGVNELAKKIKMPRYKNYLAWHVVHSLAQSLPKNVVDEHFTLEQALSGTKEQRDRWKRCVDGTDHAMGELLGQPFVDQRFSKDSKQAVETMVFAIRDAFGKNLEKIDWMDEATKAKAKEKLSMMAYLIGYPSKWRQYDFAVDEKSHLSNVLEARKFETKRRLDKVGKPLDREEWQMSPPTVNAYYDPLKNHMVFPAGILQPPFYSAKAHIPVNMGAMGMVVGHELTHGFDDEGSQFAGNGNLEMWWQPPVRKAFDERAACVDAQYEKYEPLPGVNLKGKLTLGENIADIGGVKLAFAAYRAMRAEAKELVVASGFTEDQQFFLSVGQSWCAKARDEYARQAAKTDPHSPPRFRVNGSLSDTAEFAAAFSCAKGTAMNPDKACSVW